MRTQLPVVADRARIFGRHAVGEGCDAGDPRPPGKQGDLVELRSLAYVTDAPTLAPDAEEVRG